MCKLGQQHGGSVRRGLGLFGVFVFLLETKLLVGVKVKVNLFFQP